MTTPPTKPLRGKELLSKLKEISHLSKAQKARACGYVSQTRKGTEKTDMSGFMQAVLQAKGFSLEPERKTGRGKTASYRVSVHHNGQIVVGKAYTEMMQLQPGDEFEIKLGYKHIHLLQIDSE